MTIYLIVAAMPLRIMKVMVKNRLTYIKKLLRYFSHDQNGGLTE